MGDSKEMPKLTKKIVKRVKALRPEAQVRLNHYLQWFHDSAHHQAQMHIWSTADPGDRACLAIASSEGTREVLTRSIPGGSGRGTGFARRTGRGQPIEGASPLIVFTSEGEEDGAKDKEEGDREISPQLQHASETATAFGAGHRTARVSPPRRKRSLLLIRLYPRAVVNLERNSLRRRETPSEDSLPRSQDCQRKRRRHSHRTQKTQ